MKTDHTIDGVDANILRANSRKTARPRKALSAPVRLLKERGCLRGRVLDYGCGRGNDADEIGADKYDPAYFPTSPKKKYDTIVCVYVLNVLPPDDGKWLVERIRSYLKKNGTAYIAVRRDVKKEGVTSINTLQHNADVPGAIPYESKPGRFAIYYVTRT